MNSKNLFEKSIGKRICASINGIEFEIRKPTVSDVYGFFSEDHNKKEHERVVDALIALSFQKKTNEKFFIDPEKDKQNLMDLPFNMMADAIQQVNSVFIDLKQNEKKST